MLSLESKKMKKSRSPKPFPHLCPTCGHTSVYPVKTNYTTRFGQKTVTRKIILNRCCECGGEILPQKALDQLTDELEEEI